MCRGVLEGGRRCPCNRGDRRRAAQRARYAARKSEAAVEAANAGGSAAGSASVAEPEGPLAGLLAIADTTPHALSAAERAQVLDYSREQAALTRAAVDEEWVKAVEAGGGTARDSGSGDYEAALRAHGEHLVRAVAVSAQDRIEAAGADEASLTAAGAFSQDTDSSERLRLVEEARAIHLAAWKESLAAEMPHRKFGNVQPNAEFGTGMTKKRQADFAAAAAFYPDGMIRHADKGEAVMRVRMSTVRAHYTSLRRFPTRKKVPVYNDAYDIVSTLKHKVPGEPPSDAVKGALSWAGKSYSASGPSGSDGVAATPENREILNQVLDVWKDSDSIRKWYGAKPEVVEIDNRLFLRGGKTKSLTTGSVYAAELTTNGSTDTSVHELAHRMEASNRRIGAACRAFHARRTQGLSPTVYAGKGKKAEMATKDGFVDHYVGKDYPNSPNHTEVFSMGMEAVSTGRFGGLSGQRRRLTISGFSEEDPKQRVDREHHALILGLLSTASADKD